MRQNPFSLYDFLGYVFPGALALSLIAFLISSPPITGIVGLAMSFGVFLREQGSNGTLSILEETVLLVIISYVLGHIVAYLSSLTIERFAIWVYNYPSSFLLKATPPNHYWDVKLSESDHELSRSMKSWKKGVIYTWRVVIAFFLFPITICTLILGKCFGVKDFIINKLDHTLIMAIQNNQNHLAESLGINLEGEEDFHRILYHYEYEHQNTHVKKLDNYVALYGFLRALTFIFYCLTLWITCKYIVTSFKFGADINWSLVGLFTLLLLTTYVLFLAFIKFYRRFTLEGFMCLVIDDSFKAIHTQEWRQGWASLDWNSGHQTSSDYSFSPYNTSTQTDSPSSNAIEYSENTEMHNITGSEGELADSNSLT